MKDVEVEVGALGHLNGDRPYDEEALAEFERLEREEVVPPPSDDDDPDGQQPTTADAALVEMLATEYKLDRVTAELIAPRVQERTGYERMTVIARRIVREQDLVRDADLESVDVVTAAALLARDRPPRPRVFGDLVLDGHNVTVVATKKAGKTTLVTDMARAAVTGGNFLGRYPVSAPMRAAFLNYELDERDMDARFRRLGLEDAELDRLLVFNLRGVRLPLLARAGRAWLVERLQVHRTDVLFVDPFGAAYAAAGGESENDNAEVRRFTTALDEIKREAGVGTLVMPVHTGTAVHEEGAERGRGASVVEDWPDVTCYLTKDKQGARFLRTDGRAPFRLDESRLGFDEATGRVMLATDDLGVSRARARHQARLHAVIAVIREQPGLSKNKLRDALRPSISNNDDQDLALAAAIEAKVIHVHTGARNANLHHPGPPHLDDEQCPGGRTP